MKKNQPPTTTMTQPLHRFTAGPAIRRGWMASAASRGTATAATTRSAANTMAAVANAQAVATGPETRLCEARPASSGPVHPNPISR